MVLEIEIQVKPPSTEYSHETTEPVFPDKVKVPLLFPAQTVALAFTVPGVGPATVVIVTADELADAQPALCTTARYIVVTIMFR